MKGNDLLFITLTDFTDFKLALVEMILDPEIPCKVRRNLFDFINDYKVEHISINKIIKSLEWKEVNKMTKKDKLIQWAFELSMYNDFLADKDAHKTKTYKLAKKVEKDMINLIISISQLEDELLKNKGSEENENVM